VVDPEEVVADRSEFELGWPDAKVVVGVTNIERIANLVVTAVASDE